MNKSNRITKYPLHLLVAFTIIAIVITVVIVYSQHRANIQRSKSLENYLAQYFNSSIRTELFDLVLSNNRVDLCDELAIELTLSSDSLRRLNSIRSSEMSREWRNSNKGNNYNSINYDYTLWANDTRGFVSKNNALTNAANEVLKHKRDVWQKADYFALENNLYQPILLVGSSDIDQVGIKNLLMEKQTDHTQTDANLVAEYIKILSDRLINAPRTFDYFMRLEEISEINISTNVLLGDFYSNEKAIDDFRQVVRKYSFVKAKDGIEFQPKYYITVYYSDRNRVNPDWFEVGDDYIRIDGSWLVLDEKGFTTKYEDPNKVDYRLIKKGIYESSPEFLREIEQWIEICKSKES